MCIAYNLHFVILCSDYLFFFNRLTNFIEANKVLGDKATPQRSASSSGTSIMGECPQLGNTSRLAAPGIAISVRCDIALDDGILISPEQAWAG